MNKQELLKKYISDMNKSEDTIRTVYPNTTGSDAKHMQNGFQYCQRVSINWIEQLIDYLDTTKLKPITDEKVQYFDLSTPLQTPLPPISETKQKPLKKTMTALGAGAKDMMGDIFKLMNNSGTPPGLQKKEETEEDKKFKPFGL